MEHTARVNGKSYQIPDIWIMGWVQARRQEGHTVDAGDAIRYWAWQCELEETFNRG